MVSRKGREEATAQSGFCVLKTLRLCVKYSLPVLLRCWFSTRKKSFAASLNLMVSQRLTLIIQLYYLPEHYLQQGHKIIWPS